MTGETNLTKLISRMEPVLDPLCYVFCSFESRSLAELAGFDPAGLFVEAEGITAILPAEQARSLGLADAEWYRKITLSVHSSLEAVGLTAAVAAALAQEDIPANVVAAYFHDHVFVPQDRAEKAISVLQALSRTGN